MSFFENNISANRQPVNNTYTAPVKETGTSQLSKLSVGQKFSGEITDISKSTVTIRLDNGQTLQAKLQENYHFNVGERISFEVKSNSSSLIEIRPVIPGQEGIAPTALRALETAGLPVNEKSLELIKALMNQQMPIDRTTLSRMYKMVLSNSMADPASLVEMTKLNIPVTKENVAQFENYKNFNHQISSQVDMLAEELPKLLAELSKEGNVNTSEFHGKLLSIIMPDNESIIENASVILKESAENVIPEEGGIASDITGEAKTMPKEGVLTNPETAETAAGIKQGESKVNTQNSVIPETINGEKEGNPLNGDKNTVINQSSTEGPVSEKNLIGNNPENVRLGEIFDRQALKELVASLKDISSFNGTPLNEKGLSMLQNGEITVKDFFEAVKAFQNAGENLHPLMENRVYHKLIGLQFENNMLMNPETVADKEQVEKYYSRLKEMTNQASHLMEMVGKEATPAAKQMSNLSENIDFMNQLNQMFTYVQLPLKLAGEAAHGDLYVFTKKKNLMDKEGKVSALLRLELDSLGNMDIYVELEKTVVSASFRMKNEDSLKFLENNIDILIEKLKQRGYTPSAEFKMQNDEPDFVQDFLEREQTRHSIPMQRFSFDVKA